MAMRKDIHSYDRNRGITTDRKMLTMSIEFGWNSLEVYLSRPCGRGAVLSVVVYKFNSSNYIIMQYHVMLYRIMLQNMKPKE